MVRDSKCLNRRYDNVLSTPYMTSMGISSSRSIDEPTTLHTKFPLSVPQKGSGRETHGNSNRSAWGGFFAETRSTRGGECIYIPVPTSDTEENLHQSVGIHYLDPIKGPG